MESLEAKKLQKETLRMGRGDDFMNVDSKKSMDEN